MTLERLLPTAAAALLAVSLYACGGRDAKSDSDTSAGAASDTAAAEATADTAPTSSATSTTSSADATQAPLTTADIDRWDRGMAGELEAVHSAAGRMKEARNGNDTLTAMMGLQETATMDAGAKAAGVDLQRYKVIRSNLSAAASYLAPTLGGVDTTILSADQRAEMRRMNASQLEQMKGQVPDEVIQALTPRAAELRKKDLELTGTRLKGAGM